MTYPPAATLVIVSFDCAPGSPLSSSQPSDVPQLGVRTETTVSYDELLRSTSSDATGTGRYRPYATSGPELLVWHVCVAKSFVRPAVVPVTVGVVIVVT